MEDRLRRLTFREPGPDDVAALAAHMVEGLWTYCEFQPEGWTPPPPESEAARTAPRIADPAAWKRVALDGADIVGQVLVEPARDVPGVAHVANFFVSPSWWGSGLAAHLHGVAVAAMRERGYGRARLFTPVRQARARRFYEREGWREEGEGVFEPGLGLDLVQYRLTI